MDLDYVVVPAIILIVGVLMVWLCVRRFCSLSASSYSGGRRLIERVFLSIAIFLATAADASSSFNAISLYYYRATHPPAGAFYIVHGYKMHIDCTGAGSPTIVLEAGAGNDASTWEEVQPELSKTTRVCSYDRAGYGWSERQPGPNDAIEVADNLHELLAQAKVSGPIVLMGHSIGGLYVREFVTRYPADVAGIVFVDSSSPSQFQTHELRKTSVHELPWMLYRTAMILGIPRLLRMSSYPVPFMGASRDKAEQFFHLNVRVREAEENSMGQSGEEASHTGPYGSLPILIFSEDFARWTSGPDPPKTAIDAANRYNQWHEDFKKLSTRSRRIIAQRSGHFIQVERADLIEKEVPLFIEQIRGTAPQPANYGSTVTE
jgi:pimeloyl-ACP methyl ester carboxylesterase